MTTRFVRALALAALSVATTAQAADSKILLPIADAMAANDARGRLGNSVHFYFGKQNAPKVLTSLGVDKTSQRTNAFGKADATACNWVFLSALLQLDKHARSVGANAVINIVSNYKNVEFSSDGQYECHVGAIMAGVALKGEFVKVAD